MGTTIYLPREGAVHMYFVHTRDLCVSKTCNPVWMQMGAQMLNPRLLKLYVYIWNHNNKGQHGVTLRAERRGGENVSVGESCVLACDTTGQLCVNWLFVFLTEEFTFATNDSVNGAKTDNQSNYSCIAEIKK